MKTNDSSIFISHHSSKVDLVTHLSRYLEKNGLQCWYAPRDIRSGEEWDKAIHDAIRDCKAVILLFCAQADSSKQIKRELSLADKYKKPVFWLRIERVEPNNLSYYLSSTQWLDWLDARDDTLEKLVRDISSEYISSVSEQPEISSAPSARPSEEHLSLWSKGILAFENDRDAAECAARVYFGMANRNPDSSVVLPTGRSATMLFRSMVRISNEYEGCPFGDAHIISDTETFGVWTGHETSRTRHIIDMLITPLEKMGKGPCEENLHLLSGIYMDSDPVKTAQKIIRLYPPSVHAVSVSPVGEILAYEVGTYEDIDDIIDDAPRVLEVGEHSKKYIDPNQPSKSILSIGLGTALSSEILLILAFDIQKANILHRLFNGPITAGIPATILRNHPNAYVITTLKVLQEAKLTGLESEIKKPEEAAKWIIGD